MRFSYYLGRRYPEYDFYLGVKPKSEQFRARNKIVEAAQEVNADYLLMIDDDHIIDTEEGSLPSEKYEFLHKLIAHDVDIVGPLYYQRGGEAKPVVMKEIDGAYFFLQDHEIERKLQEVAVQGGGCMLIKMRIFDKIKPPFFEPEFQFGTDVQVCRKARALGFKVYCDTSIELGHVLERRVIITSANKDVYRTDAQNRETANMVAGWQASSVLFKYKAEAMEYLGIKEETELTTLYESYSTECAKSAIQYGMNTPGYYANLGKAQLARQVLYHHSDWARIWDSYVLQIIKCSVAAKCLDFGCGSAPLSWHFLHMGHEVHFIDIDGAYAYEFLKWRVAKHGLDHRAHYNWPEEDSCNYALFCDSIEHMEDWQTPLLRAIDCLKEGGFIISNFPMLKDIEGNSEHIFTDKGEWAKFMFNHNMHPMSSTAWQKKLL